jgi:hypothetical protein
MKERIDAFLADLDQSLMTKAKGRHLHLYHIGRSALVWQYAYNATTQDLDTLRPDGEAELLDWALRWFGVNTPKAGEHGLYLQVVDDW